MGLDAFVMIVDSHGKNFFGPVLANDVFVKNIFNFSRFRDMNAAL
jgi:hypothetical protein